MRKRLVSRASPPAPDFRAAVAEACREPARCLSIQRIQVPALAVPPRRLFAAGRQTGSARIGSWPQLAGLRPLLGLLGAGRRKRRSPHHRPDGVAVTSVDEAPPTSFVPRQPNPSPIRPVSSTEPAPGMSRTGYYSRPTPLMRRRGNCSGISGARGPILSSHVRPPLREGFPGGVPSL